MSLKITLLVVISLIVYASAYRDIEQLNTSSNTYYCLINFPLGSDVPKQHVCYDTVMTWRYAETQPPKTISWTKTIHYDGNAVFRMEIDSK